MPRQFEISDGIARGWLAEVVTEPPEDSGPAFHLEDGWQPSADYSGRVGQLIEIAQDVGALACEPGVRLRWEELPDGFGRYLVQFEHPQPVTLTLAAPPMDRALLDTSLGDGRAVTYAIAVLVQAADAASEQLRSLGWLVGAEAGVPF